MIKLNYNPSVKAIKNQAPKKVVYSIDTYLIENHITTIKLCTACIILS